MKERQQQASLGVKNLMDGNEIESATHRCERHYCKASSVN